MKKTQEVPEVFDYLNYREFLRDYYHYRKEKGSYSYRNFSKRAGLGSPNYLKMVIDGDRNLSSDMATRFTSALGLDAAESSYFVDLVAFCQAADGAEKELAYARLTSNKSYRKARRLDAHYADYHSQWYVPAVRELAARPDFQAEPSWIGKRLWPPISEEEAQHALYVLKDLGLLVPHSENPERLRQGEPLITTGPEARAFHIARYHRLMLSRAAESITLIPREQRDISALTLCIDKEGLANLKERIVRFRQEIMAMAAAAEDDAAQVVQLNLQLFPLSKPEEDVDQ